MGGPRKKQPLIWRYKQPYKEVIKMKLNVRRFKKIRKDYGKLEKSAKQGFMMDVVMYDCDEDCIKAFWLDLPDDVQMRVMDIFNTRVHNLRREIMDILIEERDKRMYGDK